jgi:hypothetical protein
MLHADRRWEQFPGGLGEQEVCWQRRVASTGLLIGGVYEDDT